jgi:phage protein D
VRKSSTAYRYGGTYEVFVPSVPSLQARPSQLDLHQKEGHHDVLVATFPNFRPAWAESLVPGTPISVRISNGAAANTWYGYVAKTTAVSAAQLSRPTKVYCVGSSYPLKQRGSETFSNLSLPDAVGVLARRVGLSYVGQPHPRVFRQLALTGETQWQWIQQQAERIGYVAMVEKSTLYFRSIDRTIDERMVFVPKLTMMASTASPDKRSLQHRTLDHFEIVREDSAQSEHPRLGINVANVDLDSRGELSGFALPEQVGRPIREGLDDTLFTGFDVSETVESAAEAKQVAQDLVQRRRFSTEARAKGFGDPRIGVFSTVNISGTGNRSDGFWAVQAVHHQLQGGSGLYVADMHLISDGEGANSGSTFRRRFDHEQAVIDVASRIATPLPPQARTNFRYPASILSTSSTAGASQRRPGQWVSF